MKQNKIQIWHAVIHTDIIIGLMIVWGVFILYLTGCSSQSASFGPKREPVHALVMTFEDLPGAAGSGRVFTPAFRSAMESVSYKNNTPYVAISNLALHKTLKELNLEFKEWEDPAQQMQIARHAGADVIITGKVTAWKKGNIAQSATVGFDAECVSTTDGSVLWTISETGSPFKMALEERTQENCAKEVATKGVNKIKGQL